MNNIKVVAVGDGAVGKTSMLLAYCTGSFPDRYCPTIFDNYVTDVLVNGHMYTLGLWDTAGQEDYDRLRPLSYPQTDVFLACFGVDSPDSLDNIKSKWFNEITYYCSEAKVILVGTKCDLRDNRPNISPIFHAKKPCFVSEEQAREVARSLGAHSYVECSALCRKGLREVFNQAIRAAVGSTNPKPKSKPRRRISNLCFLL